MSAGILSPGQVKKLASSYGATTRLYKRSSAPFEEDLIGLSAIDLPIGERYWEMKGSRRPGASLKVADIIQEHSSSPSDGLKLTAKSPAILRKRHVYLFEVDCCLDFSGTRHLGKATARSSIGRLDTLVRLLVDEADKFDWLGQGKKHQLFVEVTPISFDLEVEKGTALSQLRLFKGQEHDISLTREELYHEDDDDFPVIGSDELPYRDPCDKEVAEIWFPFRLDLSRDQGSGCCAFKAKKEDGLPPINPAKQAFYDPKIYWEGVPANGVTIDLEPDSLYILRSKERLHMPGHLALECQSYTTLMGEWRIEYAGFAHPWFGSSRKKGTPIIFEVRGHNVPTILTDGIPLGNVRFLRMSETVSKPTRPEKYGEQELKLSACFKSWPT